MRSSAGYVYNMNTSLLKITAELFQDVFTTMPAVADAYDVMYIAPKSCNGVQKTGVQQP